MPDGHSHRILLVDLRMKKFKNNSIIFIAVIAVIFGCNIYYLYSLYSSIRSTVERDVMNAIADADFDELWIRTDNAKTTANVTIDDDQNNGRNNVNGELATYQAPDGNLVSTTSYPDGTVKSETTRLDTTSSYTNRVVNTITRQFHNVVDNYIGINLPVLDSVLTRQLNERHIYPATVITEVVDSVGNVVTANRTIDGQRYDTFIYCFNPDAGLYYKVYLTPLTHHILSQMMGVIITLFLLMVAFAAAFRYLFQSVSRLKTIEEMKDDFVNNMTHELKTPIAIAYSANDAMLHYDNSDNPEKRTAYLTIALKQLKHLGELVENILAVSMERRKTMPFNPELIPLPDFINDIAGAQRMRGDKLIRIDVTALDNVTVSADRTHLANVLNNLIDNSIKYSGQSVDIRIKCDAHSISIADNGTGIPSRSIPYIFDRFYRVPHGNIHSVRGYGIGLYYVKQILDKMGWSISVNSKEGAGTIFTIKFKFD